MMFFSIFFGWRKVINFSLLSLPIGLSNSFSGAKKSFIEVGMDFFGRQLIYNAEFGNPFYFLRGKKNSTGAGP
jgi:hypothetical protein